MSLASSGKTITINLSDENCKGDANGETKEG